MIATAVRGLGALAAIVVGGVGVVSMPPAAAAAVLTTGAMAGILHVSHRAGPVGLGAAVRSGRLLVARITAVAAAAFYLLTGLVVLVGPAAFMLALFATAALGWRAGPVVAWRRARTGVPPPSDGPEPSGPEPIVVPTDLPVASLTTGELCRLWRVSYLAVAASRDPTTLDHIARTRRHCLDELERRDPAGFRRWIEAGARAAGDPVPYIHRSADTRRGDSPA